MPVGMSGQLELSRAAHHNAGTSSMAKFSRNSCDHAVHESA